MFSFSNFYLQMSSPVPEKSPRRQLKADNAKILLKDIEAANEQALDFGLCLNNLLSAAADLANPMNPVYRYVVDDSNVVDLTDPVGSATAMQVYTIQYTQDLLKKDADTLTLFVKWIVSLLRSCRTHVRKNTKVRNINPNRENGFDQPMLLTNNVLSFYRSVNMGQVDGFSNGQAIFVQQLCPQLYPYTAVVTSSSLTGEPAQYLVGFDNQQNAQALGATEIAETQGFGIINYGKDLFEIFAKANNLSTGKGKGSAIQVTRASPQDAQTFIATFSPFIARMQEDDVTYNRDKFDNQITERLQRIQTLQSQAAGAASNPELMERITADIKVLQKEAADLEKKKRVIIDINNFRSQRFSSFVTYTSANLKTFVRSSTPGKDQAAAIEKLTAIGYTQQDATKAIQFVENAPLKAQLKQVKTVLKLVKAWLDLN
jgi:hypothetical protein